MHSNILSFRLFTHGIGRPFILTEAFGGLLPPTSWFLFIVLAKNRAALLKLA